MPSRFAMLSLPMSSRWIRRFNSMYSSPRPDRLVELTERDEAARAAVAVHDELHAIRNLGEAKVLQHLERAARGPDRGDAELDDEKNGRAPVEELEGDLLERVGRVEDHA